MQHGAEGAKGFVLTSNDFCASNYLHLFQHLQERKHHAWTHFTSKDGLHTNN